MTRGGPTGTRAGRRSVMIATASETVAELNQRARADLISSPDWGTAC